jgi:hypothetical protein
MKGKISVSKSFITYSCHLLFALVVASAMANINQVVLAQSNQTHGGINKSSLLNPYSGKIDLSLNSQESRTKPQQRCNPLVDSSPTNLSGTYRAKINYPEGGLSGDAMISIENNQFTLTSGSSKETGRIVATTTCGHTAVSLTLGDLTTPPLGQAPPPLPTISMKATTVEDGSKTKIELVAVPGEDRSFTLTLNADPDNMFDVEFQTDPANGTVNYMTDLAWKQCPTRQTDMKKCKWVTPGRPEKMNGVYHYLAEWPDGRTKDEEINVTGNKVYTIVP